MLVEKLFTAKFTPPSSQLSGYQLPLTLPSVQV